MRCNPSMEYVSRLTRGAPGNEAVSVLDFLAGIIITMAFVGNRVEEDFTGLGCAQIIITKTNAITELSRPSLRETRSTVKTNIGKFNKKLLSTNKLQLLGY